VHWDDVPVRELEAGELRWRRRRLGAAAGTTELGLSLWEVAPGARSTPLHVHADEEELCFVLRGSGVSVQDDRAYAIGEGDLVVHRAEAEAHTVVAGPEGITFLMFAEGSRTHLTYLPRTQMLWAATRWVPTGSVHPFEAEVEAGPLELPPVSADPPPSIVALDEAPVQDLRAGELHVQRRDLGRLGGSVRTGLKHLRIAPGGAGQRFHCHSAEEELFVVLGGEGTLRLGDEEVPVGRGHVVGRPPGSGIAHQLVAGERGLEVLAFGHRRPTDLCFYPETNKVWLRGLGVVVAVEPADL
jgi:uncharacterized cupin superfamily protein